MNDIGLSKAETARKKLIALNDQLVVNAYKEKLTNTNALETIGQYDLVIDATDNFASRYMINDACVLLNKPLIYGAISKFEGQVAVFNVNDASAKCAANYRDLFPEPLPKTMCQIVPKKACWVCCQVLSELMQANEAIKLITGIGTL